jgi:hypothetical protein
VKYPLATPIALVLATAVALSLTLLACREVPASEPPESAVAQVSPAPGPEFAPSAPAAPPEAALDGTEHFGAPLRLEGPALTLDEALATCVDTGQPCKVEATIERVCQNRGCWFSLVAPGVTQAVRVRMQDYGFFVPSDVTGAQCTFEGTLSSETISQETAQHYADEAVGPGETPRQVDGPETIYSFLITGVELRR